MQIHLKKGEKIYVNGAVLRVDRRTTLEFLNDIDFLLEGHVIQAQQATTPFRQLYFVVQSMLMDPANAGMTQEVFKHLAHRLGTALETPELSEALREAVSRVDNQRYFDALRQLRIAFQFEDRLLSKSGADRGATPCL